MKKEMKNTLDAYYQFEHTFFHYNRCQSISMSKPHFHDRYEIYYLIEGKRRYVIENQLYDLNPGDMILIPEMVPHKVWNTPDTSPEEYHARFLLSPKKEQIPEVFLPCFDKPYYHLTPEERAIVLATFDDLQRYQQKDMYTPYLHHASLTKILYILTKHSSSGTHDTHFTPRELRMQEAATYIKENCSQPITLEELAQKYSFAKDYFSTAFKKIIGFGFNEYLNQMRITKATQLLINTKLTIIQISQQCGFNDSNYFSAVFKKITGVPPKDFRKEHRKE